MKSITTLFIFIFFILPSTNNNLFSQNGLDFDGQNDNIIIYSSSVFDLSTGTLEAWINTGNSGTGYRGVIVKQLAYSILLNNNELGTYDWYTSTWRGSGQSPNDGIWHHVAITFNSGSANNTIVYLDGTVVLTTTITVNNQSENLVIGQGDDNIFGNQNFNGLIDEVRVWNVIRSQTEIQNSMNIELAGNESGLLAYYNFNQGVPNGDNFTETILLDSGPNGIDGTLNNFALTGTSSNWVTSNTLSIQENTIPNQNTGIFPNPGKGFIKIHGLSNSKNYRIYNALGKTVLNGVVSEYERISISSLSNGIYFLKLDDGKSFKFLKE